MKKLLILFAVTLGIFCFGSVAMGERITVYGDYGTFDDDGIIDFDHLTIGGEFNMEPFVFGGFYSTCLSTDPEPPSFIDLTNNIVSIYGGYKFLSGDALNLAGIAGHFSLNTKIEEEGFGLLMEGTTTSIGIGAKGDVNLDPITISAIILLGVSNEYELTEWDDYDGVYYKEKIDENVDLTYFELKGAYQLTDSLSAYLAYRSIDFSVLSSGNTMTEFSIGVQYMF